MSSPPPLSTRAGCCSSASARRPASTTCPAASPSRARRPWSASSASWPRSWAWGSTPRRRSARFGRPAALEGVEMRMTVFLTRLAGEPVPAGEIAALRWWPDDRGLRLAPAVRDCVIPRWICRRKKPPRRRLNGCPRPRRTRCPSRITLILATLAACLALASTASATPAVPTSVFDPNETGLALVPQPDELPVRRQVRGPEGRVHGHRPRGRRHRRRVPRRSRVQAEPRRARLGQPAEPVARRVPRALDGLPRPRLPARRPGDLRPRRRPSVRRRVGREPRELRLGLVPQRDVVAVLGEVRPVPRPRLPARSTSRSTRSATSSATARSGSRTASRSPGSSSAT